MCRSKVSDPPEHSVATRSNSRRALVKAWSSLNWTAPTSSIAWSGVAASAARPAPIISFAVAFMSSPPQVGPYRALTCLRSCKYCAEIIFRATTVHWSDQHAQFRATRRMVRRWAPLLREFAMQDETFGFDEFRGKSVLITGASTGIGAALARAFAAQGAKIGLHFNSSKDAAEALAGEIREAGGTVALVR